MSFEKAVKSQTQIANEIFRISVLKSTNLLIESIPMRHFFLLKVCYPEQHKTSSERIELNLRYKKITHESYIHLTSHSIQETSTQGCKNKYQIQTQTSHLLFISS